MSGAIDDSKTRRSFPRLAIGDIFGLRIVVSVDPAIMGHWEKATVRCQCGDEAHLSAYSIRKSVACRACASRDHVRARYDAALAAKRSVQNELNASRDESADTRGTRVIVLSGGRMAVVDTDQFDSVNVYCWHLKSTDRVLYAVAASTSVGMHRFIMKPSTDEVVDHINHDGLDNRRSNLRIFKAFAMRANMANVRSRTGSSSRYRGVSWCVRTKSWHASISVGRTQTFLGMFSSETEAARAFDVAACDILGSVFRPNLGEYI